MSVPDPKLLSDFLIKERVSQESVGQVMAAIDGLYRQAASGRFVFRGDQVPEVVGQIVSVALGRSVRAIPVSVSNPFPKPDWMSERAYRNVLRDSFGDSLRGRLWGILGDSRDKPEHSLLMCLENTLEDSLRGKLGYSLWVSFLGSILDSPVDSPRDSRPRDGLTKSVWASLYSYTALYLTRRGEEAEHLLAPLVRLMAENPVMGFAFDDPNAVLYLVP